MLSSEDVKAKSLEEYMPSVYVLTSSRPRPHELWHAASALTRSFVQAEGV
jgi:hypothetical protein